MNIRYANLNDVSNLITIWNQNGKNVLTIPYKSELNELISKNSFFVLEDNNAIIGFCGYKKMQRDPEIRICHLLIKSEHRNCGYGKYLLNYVIDNIKKINTNNLDIVLYCKDGAENNNFYDKLFGKNYTISNTKNDNIFLRKYYINTVLENNNKSEKNNNYNEIKPIKNWDYNATLESQDPYKDIIDDLNKVIANYDNATLEEKEKIIDTVLKKIRSINVFPIIYYNEAGVSKEIKKVIEKDNVTFYGKTLYTKSKDGNLLLDFLFPNLHFAQTCNMKKSCYNRFYDDEVLKNILRKFLAKNNKITNMRTLYFSVSRYYYDTPINYNPIRAKAILEYFTPKNGVIYDYSCGYGGRMLGALSSKNNFTYIGVEPNKDTYHNLLSLGEKIEKETLRSNSFKIYNIGSEIFAPKSNSVDLAFSCPPFFKKEIYSNELTQSINKFPIYEDWLENYVRPTIRNIYNSLKENGIFIFDIVDYYYNGKKIELTSDWKKIAIEEGFYFKDTFDIRSNYRKKDENDNEKIFIFMKKQDLELPNYSTEFINIQNLERIKNLERQNKKRKICQYDIFGNLQTIYDEEDFNIPLKQILKKNTPINNCFYRIIREGDQIQQEINIKKPIAKIGDVYFYSMSDIGRYLNVSRQFISAQKRDNKNIIKDHQVTWY